MERHNDGQHYSDHYYNPGRESGMKSVIEKGRVGKETGGESAKHTGTVHSSVMVNTTTGSAGPRAVGETHGADDK